MEQSYYNSIYFTNNQIIPLNNSFNNAISTVKIMIFDNLDKQIALGSGFFLKLERNNKLFK